jgi:Tfp pilus assembly protein PilO
MIVYILLAVFIAAIVYFTVLKKPEDKINQSKKKAFEEEVKP